MFKLYPKYEMAFEIYPSSLILPFQFILLFYLYKTASILESILFPKQSKFLYHPTRSNCSFNNASISSLYIMVHTVQVILVRY